MTENTATPPIDGPSTPVFVRPREGRMLAGVCAGIAQRWGLDLTLVRIIAVVLTLFSGVGAAVYLAAWLLTPSPDAPAPLQADSPTARAVARRAERLGRRLPMILLVVIAAIAIGAVAHALWFGFPIGLLVVLLVLAFVVGTRRGRWLVGAVAALLAIALATVGIFGTHFGTRDYAVTSVDDLHSTYDYGAGRINLDLSSISSVSGRYTTDVRLGRGNVVVTVPNDVPIVVHATAGIGSVTIDGRKVSGIDAEQTRAVGNAVDASADRLDVNVAVGAGKVVVQTR